MKGNSMGTNNSGNLELVVIGCIWLKGGMYQLGVDIKTHRMYKAKKIGEERVDEKNRSPLCSIYGEFEPITEEDYND